MKVPVGEGPNALVAAAGSVWVANEFDSSITSIDPTTDSGVPVPVGGTAASLAADGGGDLWLAVGASATEHRGGTLTVSSGAKMRESDLKSLDPAVVVYNDLTGGQILSRSRTMGSCRSPRLEAPTARRWSRTWRRRSLRCSTTD